jgi:polysaccharide export outer membrane protein
VKLRREIQGQPSVLTVNLWQLVEEGEIVQDVTLRDGDRIIIPTVAENNARETRQLSQSTIAPESQPVEVAVVGEVNRPGSHEVEAGDSGTPPTVTQAIQAAGGITNFSDIRNIKVERTTGTGTQKVLNANLWELLKGGQVTENVILQSGDTIVVPRAEQVNPSEAEALASASFSPETIRVNVIGEAERTGTLELPANTPLNQAILAAGGFNTRADKGDVELVRLNANGTVTRREIDVNLDEGIDQQSNPILRNNDVIVVERSTLASVSDTVGTVLEPVTQIFQGFRFFEIFFN